MNLFKIMRNAWTKYKSHQRELYIDKYGYPIVLWCSIKTTYNNSLGKEPKSSEQLRDANLKVYHDKMIIEIKIDDNLDYVKADKDGVVLYSDTDAVHEKMYWRPRKTKLFNKDKYFLDIYSQIHINVNKI